MNSKNKLFIAAAGSGKTTFLVEEALKVKKGNVLFTTYTRENASAIKQKFISKHKCIPKSVTIKTWFSFLIQHGAKPYQGSYDKQIGAKLDKQMFEYDIKGLDLVNIKSGYKVCKSGNPIIAKGHQKGHHLYWPEEDDEGNLEKKHFFNSRNKIFSDKLSKFVFRTNERSGNKVIDRISKIYQHIFIDEAQDLAGYDLDIIKSLLKTSSTVILVADPRQVVYLTHQEGKNKQYDGKIKDFISKKCKGLIGIDEDLFSVSYRNNQAICDFSSLLYPDYRKTNAYCGGNVNSHTGIWLVRKEDVGSYLYQYKKDTIIQLKWDKKQPVDATCRSLNFGESKGDEFERVIIYPAKKMLEWMYDHNVCLADGTRAKFYVAITRAKHSVAIVIEDDNKIDKVPEGCRGEWKPSENV